MRSHNVKKTLKRALGATVLLLAAGFAHAQQAVNLTAGPTSANLPDGNSVPMWGYTCGAPVTGSLATCTALNPTAASAGLWSPVIITVPTGETLQVNLTNHLIFGPSAVGANKIPTSLVIVGQVGGGLGDGGTSAKSPQHDNQGTTWPIANAGPAFTPPAQGPRVQSFSTEVAGGATTTLTWATPNAGTYLMESGTHPSIQAPMGLVGMVVVTSAPSGGTAGTAYPNVSYNAEAPLLFSEIDPAQNIAVYNAVRTVGFNEDAVRGNFGGPVSGVAVTNGGSGYTKPPTVSFSSGAPGADGSVATIDTAPNSPTFGQVTSISAPTNAGVYASTATVTLQNDPSDTTGHGAVAVAVQGNANTIAICSGGAKACYPPVVNYSPRYYMINGTAFDRTNAAGSLVAVKPGDSANPVKGSALVRMVNAGSRMHIPSIVGSAVGGKGGLGLIAEDGNVLPGVIRVQNEVFMAAGKTYDVMVDVPASGTYPVFDRQLSLAANGINRDGGMLAYLGFNGASVPLSSSMGSAQANPDTYKIVLPCDTAATSCTAATVSDPSKGVIANDINVFGVKVVKAPTLGTVALNSDGTFKYTPKPGWSTTSTDTFTYCGNGAAGNTGSSHPCETVTLAGEALENAGAITCSVPSYTANLATSLKVSAPGVLSFCKDAGGFPLTAKKLTGVSGNLSLTLDANGAFTAAVASSGAYNFTFTPVNSQGVSGAAVQVSLTFPQGSGLAVTVLDGNDKSTTIGDYRWIVEEDRTFFVDPKCTTNPPPAGCPGAGGGIVPNFGTNFHTSYMPVIATGCTGPVSCGNWQTQGGNPVALQPMSSPGDIALCSAVPAGTPCLDPNKRYYISVLPGDAAQPFIDGYTGPADCAGSTPGGECGHGMGGAPIPSTPNGQHDGTQQITVLTEPSPYPPATLTAFVFEDDYPLNGEHDAGGGLDVLAPNEPGLGGFNIVLQDNAGGTGDATGQPTYDMFNMPLSNSLAGTIDPVTHIDACPISRQITDNQVPDPHHPGYATDGTVLTSQTGVVGQIVTCPKYESDGKTLSPLAGQAVVKNLYAGRYGVIANPGADRIARGEEWVQTNTLDGQKAHDSFMRIGEPAYFQEFGPAGYHVTIGFANPKIINDRGKAICNTTGQDCTHEVKGHVTLARMSRTPDERLYGSGTRDAYSFTQCYVSIGDPDGADFGFTKCDADGNFDFPAGTIPSGNWKITTFDQWNDQVVDGITTPVGMCAPQSSIDPNPINYTTCHDVDMGEVAVHQWQTDLYTRTFLDLNGDGVSNVDSQGNPTEPGLSLVDTNVRFRDGSFSNFNSTDLNGYASFNEVFPLFNWYVVETDSTRYKNTGIHVVYDAGGPVDGSSPNGVACSGSTTKTKSCGTSNIAANLANTYEPHPLPSDLSIPGAVYCTFADTADCNNESIATGPVASRTDVKMSSGRIDPPWVTSEGWQSFMGQANFLEFGKKPFAEKENGGIYGHVVYASTRPFDDPQMLLQLSWEPLVPHVRINLYQEGVAADGITKTLTLVDHTETSSFDDWAQGFRRDANGNFLKDADGKYIPNMNCPGQGTDDKNDPLGDPYFWFALKDQPQYLDVYNNNGNIMQPLAHDAQYKCYDGMHNWNQLQPAPYDGMYSFPSVTSMDPVTGKPTGTNCTACIANPDDKDPYRAGTPMLPHGKYVVEVVVPPGFELVKEEDKNILIGDNFVAPVTQQFGGLGSIFILPDQAEVAAAYNTNNSDNATNSLGRDLSLPSHEGDTGQVETYWPCVGEERVVPDYISLFPGSYEVAPFAGATRHLCDRKEVTLTDQTTGLAKFYIFTETHTAAHFTGLITDDLQAEFDPYSPAFGEKYAPPYMPVGIKDWAGNEINRVYTDAYGAYNGLNYSTWEVNPPNPMGYGPTMMVYCMNDSGADAKNPAGDPLFHKGYSDFCYELPSMPGQTGYFDTPVVPTSAFAGGYNNPDCSYPDQTPAVSSVNGDLGVGPWVSAAGHQLTIVALGDQMVDNPLYAGPQASTAPFNAMQVKRHYGFGPAPTDFSKFAAAPKGYTYSCTTGASTTLCPYVTIGGQAMSAVSWGDTQITGNVPSNVPNCAVQQQAQYGGSSAQCGQLNITAANGRQSIDSVSVTIGGKTPTVLATGQTVQQAIDAASPGDMILLPPATYSEMVIMWKPVRLQGVGAASSVIDANPHPAGRLDPWRRQMVCLFGLALDGQPSTGTDGKNPFDPSGTYTCGGPNVNYLSGGPDYPSMVVDRIPMEGILGWDTTVNGNLAEQLIEPGLLGGYEGAGITVLAKGVKIPANQTDVWGSGSEAAFPDGTVTLTSNDCTAGAGGSNPYPSNYLCNPSSIDGVSIRNSSQGGGGIYVHAWAHNLQIANNRISSNQGTMSGGITIGQGEHVEAPVVGGGVSTVPPGSCVNPDITIPTNVALPFCYDINVNVHNNSVTQNASLGDELFSSTPAGAGGVTFCNGSDYYKFNYNWVCGNMATGDGAGVVHLGFSYDGEISHNTILFNQSANPTIATNGGGLLVMGAPDPDPPCAESNDQDCVPDPASITPSDGTGPGLLINANLIQGNSADAGSGGGLRLQHVNGTEVLNFPNGNNSFTLLKMVLPKFRIWPDISGHMENLDAYVNPNSSRRAQALTPWNQVTITNNVITNNVAGWDGGGVSMLDALAVNFVNNTVTSNNSTASSGTLFQTLFAPLASTQGVNCTTSVNGEANKGSCPQPAGLVSVPNTAILIANMKLVQGGLGAFTCPKGNGVRNTTADCTKFSVPIIANDVFWKNRSFMIGEGPLGNNLNNQQTVVSVYNPGFTDATGNMSPVIAANQTKTGDCNDTGASYWDVGVRGDGGPGNHASGGILSPLYSVLTNGSLLSEVGGGTNNLLGPTAVVKSMYCNGSRWPVEAGGVGWLVPPGTGAGIITPAGTNESNALPAPPFTLQPGAVVDEGNNWINLQWGPLAQTSPAGQTFNDPNLAYGSPAIDAIPSTSATFALAPSADFFGKPRPDPSNPNALSVGAVEFQVPTPVLSSISPTSGARGYSVAVTFTGSGFGSGGAVTLRAPATITASNIVVVSDSQVTATLNIGTTATLGANQIGLVVGALQTGTLPFTVNNPATPTVSLIAPSSGYRGSTVAVTITGAHLLTTSGVTVSGTGVTVNGLTVIDDNTVKANFVITAGAAATPRTVTVTTLGGTATTPFTVATPPPPTVTSITPTSGYRGTTVAVTIKGTNLLTTTGITVSGTGVTASGITAVDDNTVSANLVIAASAGATTRTVTVTTVGGTSTTGVNFTVATPPPATISLISPNSGGLGAAVAVTLTGTNFTTGSTIAAGSGITVGGITVVSTTQINATFTIASSATPGARSVTVTNASGTAGPAATFSVTAGTPSFTVPTNMTTTPGNLTLKTGVVTVTNTATGANAGPITFTAAPRVTRSGGGLGVFLVVGGTCTNGYVLNAGASCTINVDYQPLSTTNATAYVTINDTGTSTTSQNSPTFNAN